MQDVYFIRKLEQLKVLCDPIRVRILWDTVGRAQTGTMIAAHLGLSPSKVHYHLKELERIGIVTIERSEEKNGIVQKFYRIIAKNIRLDETVLQKYRGEIPDIAHSLRENLIASLTKSRTLVDKALLSQPEVMTQCFIVTRLTPEQYQQVKGALDELKRLVGHYQEQTDGQPYHVHFVSFPLVNSTPEDREAE